MSEKHSVWYSKSKINCNRSGTLNERNKRTYGRTEISANSRALTCGKDLRVQCIWNSNSDIFLRTFSCVLRLFQHVCCLHSVDPSERIWYTVETICECALVASSEHVRADCGFAFRKWTSTGWISSSKSHRRHRRCRCHRQNVTRSVRTPQISVCYRWADELQMRVKISPIRQLKHVMHRCTFQRTACQRLYTLWLNRRPETMPETTNRKYNVDFKKLLTTFLKQTDVQPLTVRNFSGAYSQGMSCGYWDGSGSESTVRTPSHVSVRMPSSPITHPVIDVLFNFRLRRLRSCGQFFAIDVYTGNARGGHSGRSRHSFAS